MMSGKRLPYDAEVEYLAATGTQWIDTGITAKQSLKIRAVFETNSTTSYFAYGVRAENSTISCATGNGTTLGYVRWGTTALASAVPSGLVDISQDSSGIIANGTTYSYDATQTVVEQSGYTMVVFAGRNSATTVTANMVGKFYSFEIWDNNSLVRDLIPVRKGSVGYLYDRVTRKLFGNAGSGDFEVGPDVHQYAVRAYGDYYGEMFASPRTIGYLANEEVQLGVYGDTNFIAYDPTLNSLEFVFTDAEAKAKYGERQIVTVTRWVDDGSVVDSWNNSDLYVDTHRNDPDIPSPDPLMLSIGDVPNYNLCLLVKIEDTRRTP